MRTVRALFERAADAKAARERLRALDESVAIARAAGRPRG